jgi:hemerythrin
VDDLEGIFQTHAHDDHFAGLTSLVRSEKRLKYFAVPFVRGSVQKKLAALMRLDEQSLGRYFEVHDLRMEDWNEVGRMQVRPFFSPHPVDTTVMMFRAGSREARRTYTHLSDIPSLDVLGKLSGPRTGEPALSAVSRERFQKQMLAPVDVKKVDAGGGLIHGNALDFAEDATGRLFLSHGARAIPPGMPAGARVASFGDADILSTGKSPDHHRERALAFLTGHFPGVSAADLHALAGCPTRGYPPGAAIEEAGTSEILLLVSGTVEERDTGTGETRWRGSGSLLGDTLGSGREKPGTSPLQTWKSMSALTVLAIPARSYGAFTLRPGPASARRKAIARRRLLAQCPLFASIRAENVLNVVAAAMKARTLKKGEPAPVSVRPVLMIVIEGEVDLSIGGHLIDKLGPGSFWGEERLVIGSGMLCEARAATDVSFCVIPGEVLAEIPIVQWGMQGAFERRLLALRSELPFAWSESFRVGVPLLDRQRRRLFAFANDLTTALGASGGVSRQDEQKQELLALTREHFALEERLLAKARYPGMETQRQAHAELLSLLERFAANGERRSRARTTTVVDYLKDWLIRHTLLEDLPYRPFLAKKRRKPATSKHAATAKRGASRKPRPAARPKRRGA